MLYETEMGEILQAVMVMVMAVPPNAQKSLGAAVEHRIVPRGLM